MTELYANHAKLQKTMITFLIIGFVLIGLGLTLDTGIGLRRRTSSLTLEGALIGFGVLMLIPAIFAFMQRSADKCFFKIQNEQINYGNVGFGWPIAKTYNFPISDIEHIKIDDDELKINFKSGSQYADSDRDDDDYDLEIDASVFGVTAKEMHDAMLAATKSG